MMFPKQLSEREKIIKRLNQLNHITIETGKIVLKPRSENQQNALVRILETIYKKDETITAHPDVFNKLLDDIVKLTNNETLDSLKKNYNLNDENYADVLNVKKPIVLAKINDNTIYLEEDRTIGNGTTVWYLNSDVDVSKADAKITFYKSMLGLFGGKKSTRKLRKNKRKLHNKTKKSMKIKINVKRGRKSTTKTKKFHPLKSAKRGGNDENTIKKHEATIETMTTLLGNLLSPEQKAKLYEITNMIPMDSPIRNPDSSYNFIKVVNSANEFFKKHVNHKGCPTTKFDVKKINSGRVKYNFECNFYNDIGHDTKERMLNAIARKYNRPNYDEKDTNTYNHPIIPLTDAVKKMVETEKDPIIIGMKYNQSDDNTYMVFIEKNGTIGDGQEVLWPKYRDYSNTRAYYYTPGDAKFISYVNFFGDERTFQTNTSNITEY